MGEITKTDFKVFNGTDYDIKHFSTSADQVQLEDSAQPDGATTVQEFANRFYAAVLTLYPVADGAQGEMRGTVNLPSAGWYPENTIICGIMLPVNPAHVSASGTASIPAGSYVPAGYGWSDSEGQVSNNNYPPPLPFQDYQASAWVRRNGSTTTLEVWALWATGNMPASRQCNVLLYRAPFEVLS